MIAPRYLGLRAVLAVSFARIHWQNLTNFGVLALEFSDPGDYGRVNQGDQLVLTGLRHAVGAGNEVTVHNTTRNQDYPTRHRLSGRQVAILLACGLIPWLREQDLTSTT